jgi:hypothetical protein
MRLPNTSVAALGTALVKGDIGASPEGEAPVHSPAPGAPALSWTHRILHLLVEAPVRPLRRLVLYYAALGGVSLVIRAFDVLPVLEARWSGVFLVGAMTTALALMLPVAWTYLATRQRRGVDRSVVQTMLALPLAVAGVIVVVQHSLPLAFSLAGIVAAVRFRNTLKDTADMLFVFLAIAVGLTVGAGAASAAATISVLFNLVVLALWHCHTVASHDAAVTPADPGHADSTVLAATPPARPAAQQRGKKHRYTGVLSVQVSDIEQGKPLVERVLEEHTQVWRIDEIKKKHDGRSTLKYIVRVDKALSAEFVLDAVLRNGMPYVVGAALA